MYCWQCNFILRSLYISTSSTRHVALGCCVELRIHAGQRTLVSAQTMCGGSLRDKRRARFRGYSLRGIGPRMSARGREPFIKLDGGVQGAGHTLCKSTKRAMKYDGGHKKTRRRLQGFTRGLWCGMCLDSRGLARSRALDGMVGSGLAPRPHALSFVTPDGPPVARARRELILVPQRGELILVPQSWPSGCRGL